MHANDVHASGKQRVTLRLTLTLHCFVLTAIADSRMWQLLAEHNGQLSTATVAKYRCSRPPA
jgi:hypothetical protein